jgi:hypothetical protein
MPSAPLLTSSRFDFDAELAGGLGDDHLAGTGVFVAAEADRDPAPVALAAEHGPAAQPVVEARRRRVAHLEAALRRLGHRQPERRHHPVGAVVGALDLAAGADRADRAVNGGDHDQRPADQERHEAFGQVDRRHREEDQDHDHEAELVAGAIDVPDLLAGADRVGVDRRGRHRRPEVGLGQRRRVLDPAAALGGGAARRLGVAVGDPLEVGALQDQERDHEDRDHAEDQAHGQLRVRFPLPRRGRDHDHHRGDDEDPDQAEPR